MMKNKIKYRGIPAYVDFEALTITGRNWFTDIIVRSLVVLDQYLALWEMGHGRMPKTRITFKEEDYD